MLVACLGDVMLDVIVEMPHGLSTDDDTPARDHLRRRWAGRQRRDLGDVPRRPRPGVRAARRHRARPPRRGRPHPHGVEVWGTTTGRTGAVVSLVTGGTRSMASDPGDLSWLDEVRSGAWLDGADWLFVSGYALLRTPDPQRVVETAAVARAHGTRVAVDLSSAAMVAQLRRRPRSRRCASALRPSVVFATDAEWATSTGGVRRRRQHGAGPQARQRGASFVVDGVDRRPRGPGGSGRRRHRRRRRAGGRLPARRRRPGDDRRGPLRGPPGRPAAADATVNGPLTFRGVEVPDQELAWRFSRSGGPGGQSVNTADSRVELSLDVGRSPAMPDRLRERLLARLSHRLVDGVLTVAASEYRSQHRNRQAARARLAELLTEASAPPPPRRRPTRPTRGSKERRLAGKKRRSQTKELRRRPPD